MCDLVSLGTCCFIDCELFAFVCLALLTVCVYARLFVCVLVVAFELSLGCGLMCWFLVMLFSSVAINLLCVYCLFWL